MARSSSSKSKSKVRRGRRVKTRRVSAPARAGVRKSTATGARRVAAKPKARKAAAKGARRVVTKPKARKAARAGTRPAARKAAKKAAKRAKAKPRRATRPPRKTAATRVRAARSTPARPATAEPLHWTEVLADGTHVIVRPIRKQDLELERAFIARMSADSRRMRFLGLVEEPSDDLLRRLTDLDYRHDMAFIALVHRDGRTQEIGVSRYSTSGDGRTCECAVTVSEEWRHLGLATLLMRHLIDVARARGIRTMASYDSIDNVEMQQLAAFLGFERNADPDDRTMVVHRLDL